jgi:hypothetical protein
MGIAREKFPIIWKAVACLMKRLSLTAERLASYVNERGYTAEVIKRGVKDGTEWITSDFLHACVELSGLRSGRQRNLEEDSAYDLTDEECVDLLTSILRYEKQLGLWD